MKKRYIVLEDNTVFEGTAFGADADSVGELVFATGMCGYIETLTDPSYYGQIVMQTFPLIGNYGIIEDDFEGKCCVRGYVVREWCEIPSNYRAQYDLDRFLKKKGIPGVCGVDTRLLTKTIREAGVMNALICDKIPDDLSEISAYSVKDAVKNVTCGGASVYSALGTQKYSVALMDFGAKRNIIRSLCARGCKVTVLPAFTSADRILSGGFDGIMLSNGPGDPAENIEIISEIKLLMGKIPMFGICLGHQLMALAQGARTSKLKYGHRGVNQPVKEVFGARTYITSQNHGYAVLSDTVKNGRVSFVNANDGTCEGVDYPTLCAFSVQFHPEACSGPHDTAFLFDKFCDMMGGKADAAR